MARVRASVDPGYFDAGYFARFYDAPATRIHDRSQVEHRIRGVVQAVEWLGGAPRSVLDVGAGAGHWGRWFARHRPRTRYRGVDASAHACARYGHERRDIARWRARGRFDLVLCVAVLPYLSSRDAESAIENLAAMTRTFLYLEATTRADLAAVCDLERTDPAYIPRTGRWYRARLAPHFVMLGLGLWLRRGVAHNLGELEIHP